MIVITTGGTVLAEAVPNTQDVYVYGTTNLALVNLVMELELQGFADEDGELHVDDIEPAEDHGSFTWRLRTTKPNFVLWLTSEGLNFVDYRTFRAQHMDAVGVAVVNQFL